MLYVERRIDICEWMIKICCVNPSLPEPVLRYSSGCLRFKVYGLVLFSKYYFAN